MMRFVPSTDHALFLFDLVLSVALHVLMGSAVVSISAISSVPSPLEREAAGTRLDSVQIVLMDEMPEHATPSSSASASIQPLPSKEQPPSLPDVTPPQPKEPQKPVSPIAMAPVPVPEGEPLLIEDAVLAGQHDSMPKEVLNRPNPSSLTGSTERDELNRLPQWGRSFGALNWEGEPLVDGMVAPKTAEADDKGSEAARAGSEVGQGGNTPQLLFESGRLEPPASDGSDPGLLSSTRAKATRQTRGQVSLRSPEEKSPARPSAPKPPPPHPPPPPLQDQPVQAGTPGSEAPDTGNAEKTEGQQKQLLPSSSPPPPEKGGEAPRNMPAQPAILARNAGDGIEVPPETAHSPLRGGTSVPARASQTSSAQANAGQARATAKAVSDEPLILAKLPPESARASSPQKEPMKGAEKGLEEGLDKAPEAPTLTQGAPRSHNPTSTPAPEPPPNQEVAAPRVEVIPPSLLQQLMARVVSRRVGARSHGTPNSGQLISPQAGRIGIDHQGSGSPLKPTQGTEDITAAGGQTATVSDSNSIGTIITVQSPYWEYGVQVQSRITQEFNRAGADAREALSLTGRVTLLITLEKDGRVSSHTVTNGQDRVDQIRLAQAALARCRRFPPIPDAYGVERLRFAATFDFGK